MKNETLIKVTRQSKKIDETVCFFFIIKKKYPQRTGFYICDSLAK